VRSFLWAALLRRLRLSRRLPRREKTLLGSWSVTKGAIGEMLDRRTGEPTTAISGKADDSLTPMASATPVCGLLRRPTGPSLPYCYRRSISNVPEPGRDVPAPLIAVVGDRVG
jgi:hypothetical protein